MVNLLVHKDQVSFTHKLILCSFVLLSFGFGHGRTLLIFRRFLPLFGVIDRLEDPASLWILILSSRTRSHIYVINVVLPILNGERLAWNHIQITDRSIELIWREIVSL